MAFHSLVRRGSASCFPLAIRSVAARRPFHGAISAVLRAQAAMHFLPFFRFSTAVSAKATADINLVRALESEIECAKKPAEVKDILEGFPFEIQDDPRDEPIVLNRKYQDETIRVEVDLHSIPGRDYVDAYFDDHDRYADGSVGPPPSMVVNVSKGDGQCLQFQVTAFPNEISIASVSLTNSEYSKDQWYYKEPDSIDLDENLQKAFHKYLEIRGIKPSMMKVLFKYIYNKDDKEHLMWLKILKGFVEN